MKPYCCNDDRDAYASYYLNQGGKGMPVFYGPRIQRGHGIGSLFSGLFRSIFPIFKKVAPVIGRQALSLADDLVQGHSFKDAAKARLMEGISEGINTITSPGNAQSGSGIRGRKRKKKQVSRKTRKRKVDIFS
jgi:hypothetical protein